MKLIYDKERAQQHKNEIDALVNQKNAESRIHDKKVNVVASIIGIGVFLICICIACFMFNFYQSVGMFSDSTEITVVFLLLALFFTFLAVYLVFCIADIKKSGIEEHHSHYTHDVLYYIATLNSNLLDLKLNIGEHNARLVLVLESEDGTVFNNDFLLDLRVSTKFPEETVDLENGVAYVPYKTPDFKSEG